MRMHKIPSRYKPQNNASATCSNRGHLANDCEVCVCVCNTWAPLAAIVVIWQMTVIHFEKHVMAWIIGAVFVMICVPLSLQDIHFHIIHYVHPLQRHYIRILWMIPGPQFTRFTSTSTKYKY